MGLIPAGKQSAQTFRQAESWRHREQEKSSKCKTSQWTAYASTALGQAGIKNTGIVSAGGWRQW